MPQVLLTEKNAWPVFHKFGLVPVNTQDFEGRLYSFENIRSTGIPCLFAHPFVFSNKLQRDQSGISLEFKQFSTLIRGIFLGVIDVETISIPNLDRLGAVAQGFEPRINNLSVLKGE